MTIEQVQFTDARWLQFWESFESQEHQIKSIIKLGQQIKEADPCLLTEAADWAEGYKAKPAVALASNPLKVKWQSQLDNKSGTGYRECFS